MYFGDRDSSISGDWGKSDSYSAFKRGDYDENFGSGYWTQAYKGIYQASIFIKNIHLNNKLTEEERLDMKGQARFVRAYYYWLLLRKYGPVPIMPDEGADYTLSYAELSIPRSTYEECAEYIASEMVQAAKEPSVMEPFPGEHRSGVDDTSGEGCRTRNPCACIYLCSQSARQWSTCQR